MNNECRKYDHIAPLSTRGRHGAVLIFGGLFEKYAIFQETVVASFLIDPTVIWRGFEGPGLPESRKIEQKIVLEFCCFFGSKIIRQGSVFMDFGVHLGVSFGAPGY